jgi:hypothetical protein
MKKEHNAVTERYLVPVVLFLLNICLAQVIHAFAFGSTPLPYRIMLVVAVVLLGGSLCFKKKILLTGSILFYGAVALWLWV